MPKIKDYSGQKFNRLTAISKIIKNHRGFYNCICECGNYTIVRSDQLISGDTKSCGCLCREVCSKLITQRNITHGLINHPLYPTWCNIKGRCYNRKNPNYINYGGRGITVCSRWIESFPDFLSDMGEKSHPNLTIERINNNKGYSPENCKWATRREQNNNSRHNYLITKGNYTLTITQWSKKLRGCDSLVRQRLDMGWTEHKAVTTPLSKCKSKRLQ